MRRLWLIAVIVALASPVHAAVLTVTNTNDDGPGSLRDCVEQALPGDVIEFDPSLDGLAITLRSEITIAESIVIRGRGPEQTIVRGRGNFDYGCEVVQYANRVIVVAYGAEVEISDLTVRDGVSFYGNGGGISSFGALTLRNCTIERNFACPYLPESRGGGGIYNKGQLRVIACTIRDNVSSLLPGSGIWSSGSLEVIDSTFTENWGTGGGGIHAWGSVIVERSAFRSTDGVYYEGPGEMRILNSEFTDNSMQCEGGSGSCPAVEISHRRPCSLVVDGCTFSRNSGGVLSATELRGPSVQRFPRHLNELRC